MREGCWFAPIAVPASSNENTVLLNIVRKLGEIAVFTYKFSTYMALAPKPTAAAFTSGSKEIIDKWEYSNLPRHGTCEGQM